MYSLLDRGTDDSEGPVRHPVVYSLWEICSIGKLHRNLEDVGHWQWTEKNGRNGLLDVQVVIIPRFSYYMVKYSVLWCKVTEEIFAMELEHD